MASMKSLLGFHDVVHFEHVQVSISLGYTLKRVLSLIFFMIFDSRWMFYSSARSCICFSLWSFRREAVTY